MPSPSTADRDFLFGVLALELDLVTRDQLLRALTAHMHDPSLSFVELLRTGSALTPNQMHTLERRLLAHQGDDLKTVAAPREPLDGEVDTSLAVKRDGEETLLEPLPDHDSPGLRYRIVRPHARGGLGEVFVAEDLELHRPVALKAIQTQHADHPESRTRFVLEAEITGGLEHPGIVPVYGLGVYADGRPFYAMRFIQGENLLEAVRRYHTDKGSTASERNLAFRALLSRFVAVCQAIAFAHNRGIIHRDVKPGNIMLGKFGETLVVDWGLAKATGQRDPSAEPALQPRSGQGVEMTIAGQAVGTPAYMSPEQAGGLREEIGPASDIYSLGATLYVLLTGQLAFKGAVAPVLDKVRQGEFPPPRRVNPELPPALEAICLKAMSLKPSDRYASALALAEDVEHWLADEPVSAYREPWLPRLARWVRRNRVKVSVAMAALFLLTTFSLIVAILVQRQNATLGRKNEELEDANRRVRESARDARQAIEDMTSEEALKFLETQAELRPEQRSFLERALAYYRRYVSEDAEDSSERERQARAYRWIGYSLLRLGRLEEAVAPYQESIVVYDALVKDHPAVAEFQRNRGRSLFALGAAYHTLSKPEDAERIYRRALLDQEKLRETHAGVPVYERDVGATHEALGKIYMETSQRPKAEVEFARALQIFERLAKTYPHSAERQHDLAGIRQTVSIFYRNTSREKDAVAQLDQTVSALEKLRKEHPGVVEYQRDLAEAYLVLGSVRNALRESTEAEAMIRNGIGIFETLAQLHPAVPDYQLALARAYNSLGMALFNTPKRHEETERLHRQGMAVLEKLGRAYPAVPRFQQELSRAYQGVAFVVRNRRADDPEAGRLYVQAITILEKLVREHPTETRFGTDLGTAYFKYGAMVSRQGPPRAALEWYDKSVASLEDVLKREARSTAARFQLRTVSIGRGRILMKVNRPKDAIVDWDRAAQLEDHRIPAIHHERMLCLMQLGRVKEALAEADILEPEKGLFAYAWVDLACVYARGAEAEQGNAKEKVALRAVEMLDRAVAGGYKDLKRIDTDKDLDGLRQRADYQKALEPLRVRKEP